MTDHDPDVPRWSHLVRSRWFVTGAALMIGAVAARQILSVWRLAASHHPGPNGDISVYINAIDYLKSGGELYDYPLGGGYGFIYPPFAAILLRPMTWASSTTTGIVWLTVCLIVALLVVAVLVRGERGPVTAPPGLLWLLLGISVFLGSAQVQSDLITGQVNLVLALLLLLDVGGLLPSRARGALVGIAAAIKLTPFVAIGWFAVTRQWRAFAVSVLSFALCTGLAWLVMPRESLQFWTSSVFHTGRPGDVMLRFNATVMGGLARAGVDGPARAGLWLLLGGAVVLIAYWRAEQARRHGDHVAAAIIVGCAAVLATPIAWPHHQIWLPLAGLVLLMRATVRLRVAGAGLVGFSMALVPLTGVFDQLGLTWVTPVADLAAFVAICVLGLGDRAAVVASRGAPIDDPAPMITPPMRDPVW